MRQQYHSRPTKDGCLIWDVKRLVVLTKDFPVIDVPLEDIKELDEEFWFEAEGSKPPTCRNIAEHTKLIQDCDLAYPVILSADGRVMDGMLESYSGFDCDLSGGP